MDFLVEYAKSIGKNTSKLNFGDMLKCYIKIEHEKKGGGEKFIGRIDSSKLKFRVKGGE
jgi:hypothetical protein